MLEKLVRETILTGRKTYPATEQSLPAQERHRWRDERMEAKRDAYR